MIAAGLQVMVLGMTIVFVFLILLVFLMTITSALVRRFEPAPAVTDTGRSSGVGASGTGGPTGQFDTHIPAILAAVVAHRSRIGRASQSDADSATHTNKS